MGISSDMPTESDYETSDQQDINTTQAPYVPLFLQGTQIWCLAPFFSRQQRGGVRLWGGGNVVKSTGDVNVVSRVTVECPWVIWGRCLDVGRGKLPLACPPLLLTCGRSRLSPLCRRHLAHDSSVEPRREAVDVDASADFPHIWAFSRAAPLVSLATVSVSRDNCSPGVDRAPLPGRVGTTEDVFKFLPFCGRLDPER